MSGIIWISGQSGLTAYAIVRDYAAQPWDGSSFAPFNSSNYSSYPISLTEQSATGFYSAPFPSSIAAGRYLISVHSQYGGSPADGDQVISQGEIMWDGSSVYDGVSLTTQMKSDVNAEVVDVLFVDTIPELSSGQPSATPTIAKGVMFPYMTLRNKRKDTSNESSIYNNAGSVITKAALSDTGSEFVKDKYGAP